ncbi:hypothetical protein C0995_014721 [Termitomyces sp. Mi166|nr:hypothetical protein C0995_014721 [Termitomyces sp. Mi166\
MNKRGLTIESSPVDQGYPDYMKTSPSTGSETIAGYPDGDDDIIPPTHDHRTLVLCFDGTGRTLWLFLCNTNLMVGLQNSNVVNFFSMLKKDDSKDQLVYYQAGIGTYTIPQIAKPMMAKVHKAIDSMIGIHLNAHVMST